MGSFTFTFFLIFLPLFLIYYLIAIVQPLSPAPQPSPASALEPAPEGLTPSRFFMVWGLVANRPVRILIDSGASSNFISYKLVEEMKLKMDNTFEYTIEVGNGDKVHLQGICKGLKLHMQGIEVEQNFFLMTFAGTDVVLGMDWLASLGDIRANFKHLVIKWKKGTKEFMLRGEP